VFSPPDRAGAAGLSVTETKLPTMSISDTFATLLLAGFGALGVGLVVALALLVRSALRSR